MTGTLATELRVVLAIVAILTNGAVCDTSSSTSRVQLSTLPWVRDPGPCKPPAAASAKTGHQVYRRFFANDSLIGSPIPCTSDEKICFQYNLLLYSPKGIARCHPVGGAYCDLRPDILEFQHGSGHIFGVCQEFEDPCPGYRMAYDGRCYTKEIVRDVICGCDARPTRNFLSGVECRSSPATPITVRQPTETGRCLIPDLRFADTERSKFYFHPLASIQGFHIDQGSLTVHGVRNLSCTSEQSACFSNNRLWVSGHKDCFRLLDKGPCPEDHVVALNSDAAFQGRADAVCVHVRGGCPHGQKLMAFDGKCHEDRVIQLTNPGNLLQNQYGQYVVIPTFSSVFFETRTMSENICVVQVYLGGYAFGAINPPKAHCSSNDKGGCPLFEIENEPPKPEEE